MTLLVVLVLLAPFDDLKKAYDEAVAASKWETVRGLALEISKVKDERSARFLYQEFKLASKEEHRRALVRALALMKWRGGRDFVNRHLGSEDPYFRATSLEALERLDKKAAFARAAALLQIDDDKRVRLSAAEVLARLATAEAAQALVAGAAELPPHEQEWILPLIKGLPAPLLASVEAQLRHADPEVRLVAALVLAARRPAALANARKDKDRRVALVALAAGDKKSSPLRALLKRAKGFDQRWELYDLIARARLSGPVLVEALTKAARGGEKHLRAKAAEALGRAGRGGAVATLVPLLKTTRPWQVPIGAARGLAATRDRGAIEPLVDALEKAKGRLSFEIAAALESLTGQPFGRSAAVWERWWRERGTGFQIPETPKPRWTKETAAADRYAFYGIELYSQAAAFVCDISGSMKDDRIKTLKRELNVVVRRFSSHGRFNLVFFNEKVHPWSRRLVHAKKKTKEKALEFIGALEAAGATNIWDALQAALADKDVDTIVLLTDGAPTAGKVRTTAEIKKRFLKQNRKRMILLHVVSIGQQSPDLRDMARLSGGTYVER